MEKSFQNVGIFYNPEIQEASQTAKMLSDKIANSTIYSINDLKNDIDLAITVGGDGSFLKVARYYSQYSTPILGVNMGRLGYLAQVKPDEIDSAINKIKSGQYEIENRLMLKAIGKTA